MLDSLEGSVVILLSLEKPLIKYRAPLILQEMQENSVDYRSLISQSILCGVDGLLDTVKESNKAGK